MMDETKVPERFQRAVLLHLFRNLDPAPEPSIPLILGIHGPTGEGKTFQCRRVVEGIGARVFVVSGGELESPDAGAPAELIRRTYNEARAWRTADGTRLNPSLLLLNDIDAAIGDWGERVQYTVNRQNVLGELMHLADVPDMPDGRRAPRVPVIVTGNDFTKLYGPLIRLGRMSLFNWSPTLGEKADVVRGIYPELSSAKVDRLVRTFDGQPVAFFAHLRSMLYEDKLWSYIKTTGVSETFADLAQGRVARVRVQVEIDRLIRIGHELTRARSEIRDYLTEGNSNGRDQDIRQDQDPAPDGTHQGAGPHRASTGHYHAGAVAPTDHEGHREQVD
jgi:hypothetical protein